jgi:hypothetical protein
MRITTLDILNTDIGVEVEVIDYDTDKYLGRINVNLNGKGKLVIESQVYDKPLDTEEEE